MWAAPVVAVARVAVDRRHCYGSSKKMIEGPRPTPRRRRLICFQLLGRYSLESHLYSVAALCAVS